MHDLDLSFSRWGKITRLFLSIVILITPLWFLPITLFPVSFNKHIFLTLLAFLSLIFWIFDGFAKGRFVYVKNWINPFLFLTLIIAGVSSWFSGVASLGFFGENGGEASTILNVVSYAIIFWLSASVFRRDHDLRRLLASTFVVACVVVAYGMFQAMGKWVFPWDFTRVVTFNTIGTTNALGIYSGGMTIALIAYLYLQHNLVRSLRGIFLVAMAVAGVIITYLLGYWPIFIGWLFISLILFVIKSTSRATHLGRNALVPLIVGAFSLLVIGVHVGFIAAPSYSLHLPPEAIPNLATSASINRATLSENPKNLLIGSGSGTFQYQYGLHRSAQSNQSPLWQVRFAQASSAVLVHLGEWGIVGFLVFLLTLLIVCVQAFRDVFFIESARRGEYWTGVILLLFFIFSLFFYPQNLIFYLLIFSWSGILLGTSARYNHQKYRYFALVSARPQKVFIFSLGMLAVFIVFSGLMYFQVNRLHAALGFESIETVSSGSIDDTLSIIQKAKRLDPYNDFYLRTLATAHLIKLNQLLSDKELSEDVFRQQFMEHFNAAVASVDRAREINLISAENQVALAQVYENMIPIDGKSAPQAFVYYALASEREPTNPSIFTSAGRAHFSYAKYLEKNKASRADINNQYTQAIELFEKSIALKEDYALAHFLLVQVADHRGNLSETLSRAENIKKAYPNNIGILFQLGLIHYQAGRLSNAQTVFEDVINRVPQYANALYFLGLIYDERGKSKEALEVFERLAQFNPDKTEVKAIVDNLRSGKKALERLQKNPL